MNAAIDLESVEYCHRDLYAAWSNWIEKDLENSTKYIDIIDVAPRSVQSVCYLDVVDGGEDFRLRVVASPLAYSLNDDFRGRCVSEFPYPPDRVSQILEETWTVVHTGQPLFVRRPGACLHYWQDMTKLILPATENGIVTRILMSYCIQAWEWNSTKWEDRQVNSELLYKMK